jgi:peptidoglycan/xylan/chitin deacetylase (PgdA/CDA1 family)
MKLGLLHALSTLALASFVGVMLDGGCSRAPVATEITGSSSAALIGSNYDGSELPDKTIALTFDDGPGDYGAAIADYLAGQGIKAAFFDNGDRFKTSTDLPNENNIDVTGGAYGIVQKCLDDGHIVGNHTVTHRDMVYEVLPNGSTQVNDELSETDSDLAGYIPSGFYLFRSPYGSYNSSVYADLKGKPMDKYVGDINWAFGGLSNNYPNSAADWACWQGQITSAGGTAANVNPGYPGYLTTKQCGDLYYNEITSAGHGGIVLMHDPYSWPQGNTRDMVKYLVPKLKADGYTFVRVDDVPSIRAKLPACDASCATGTSCDGVGPDHCTACKADSFRNGGTCTPCSTCAAGSFQSAACTAAADTVCATCAAGTFTPDDGETSCTACPDGSIAASAGATACTPCAAGTATNGSGQTACTTCAAGTYADAGAASCSSCAAGSAAPSDSAACTACPAGTFAGPGAGSCTACAAGSYAAAGAGSCTACGSCDDGDSCTTDTCDPMNGCFHTAIAGCSVTVDAGVDAGLDAGTVVTADAGSTSTSDAGSVSPSGDEDDDGADAGRVSGTGDSTNRVDSGTGNADSAGGDDSGGCSSGDRNGGSPGLLTFALGALVVSRKRRRMRST